MSTKKKIITIIIGIEALVIAAAIGFLFYINSDTVKANRQLELAQRYLLEEDYEQAIAAFEVAIEIDPKNAEAYLGLAEAYAATDDVENVVKILERGSKRTDSEEIREMLKVRTEEIEQKEQAARRAAEAAQAAADASQTSPASTEIAKEVPATQTDEPAEVTTGFVTRDGEIYYYDAQGNLVIGWFEESSNRYCARNDGRLYKDGEYEVDSTKYQFAPSGICLGEVKDEAWKQAYIDYLDDFEIWLNNEWLSDDCDGYEQTGMKPMFDLIYIDDDDIPELYIGYRSLGFVAEMRMVTYYNKQLIDEHLEGWAHEYIEKGGLYYVSYGSTGHYNHHDIYMLNKGNSQIIGSAEEVTNWDENSDEMYIYTWNDKEVSESEMYNNIDAVYDRSKSISCGKEMSIAEIKELIRNF